MPFCHDTEQVYVAVAIPTNISTFKANINVPTEAPTCLLRRIPMQKLETL